MKCLKIFHKRRYSEDNKDEDTRDLGRSSKRSRLEFGVRSEGEAAASWVPQQEAETPLYLPVPRNNGF
jgi:hypothetical protein